MKLRAATRGSALALWQTNDVARRLSDLDVGVAVEPVVVSTAGDRDTRSPIHAIGGKGVFVKEVQAAVLDGRADFAVHSAKDLPAITPAGLSVAAVPERADPRDSLVGTLLAQLPERARVGTGSIRRRVQLLALRPDLRIVEIRGNIDTRLGLVGELDAVVMAAAALDRLERSPAVVDRLDVTTMIPQVGQGALAIECRSDATDVRSALAEIECATSRRLVDAERAFLRELGGDCDLPAGAHAQISAGEVEIRAMLADESGSPLESIVRSSRDGDALGVEIAGELRRRLDS